jgi:diguanylate cyclase (GGDEF)-like protein/PAS domain S-box-containing protein
MRWDGWRFNMCRLAWRSRLRVHGHAAGGVRRVFARFGVASPLHQIVARAAQRWTRTAKPTRAASGMPAQFRLVRSTWRIWLVCITLIAVVVSQDGYSVWSGRKQTILDTERNVANLSLVLAEYTSRYMAFADLVLQGVQTELQHNGMNTAATFQDRASSPAIHDDLVEQVQSIPGRNALLLFSADGELVNHSRPGGTSNLSALDRDFFTHFKNSDDPGVYVSAPARSRATGNWTLFLARRIVASDGQFLGVVAAAIDIDSLQNFYRASRATSAQGVTLLRRDGLVVVRYPDPSHSIGTSMPPQSPWYGIVAKDGGTYRSPGFFGAPPAIVAARPLHDYPLVIDVVTSESDALAVWRISAIWQGAGTLVSVSSFIALFWLVGRLFRRQQLQSSQLRQERDFSTALIEGMPSFCVLIDQAGHLIRWNANLPKLTGRSDQQLQGSDAIMIAVEGDRDMARSKMEEVFIQGANEVEFGVSGASGEVRVVRWHGRIVTNKGDHYLLAIGIDVTEARAAEAQVKESEDRFRTIFDSVNDGIIVHEVGTGDFIDVNARICEMFGYTRDAFLKLDLRGLSTGVTPYTADEMTLLITNVVTNEARVFEWHCKAKDGRLFWVEISIRRAAFGGQDILLSTTRDITDRRRVSEQISYMARHDSLTGLANRRVFVESLDKAIVRAHGGACGFAVLYIDLDHFKDINDTLGHPVGDLLLQTVATRLRANVREGDTVARFGGDEFAIILNDIRQPEDAAGVSHRILDAISARIGTQKELVAVAGVIADKVVKAVAEPVVVQGTQIRSGATIGIAIYGADSLDAETMLSHADLALYRAKSEGRGAYRFFTEAMDTEVRARVRMNTELGEAITSGQFFLMYQPQVEIGTNYIVGLESLVRWRHPIRGIMGPGRFIPVTESNGLIVPLGHWIMREACRQTKQWRDAGIAPPLISVNLSGVQFKNPQDLESDIAAIIAEFDLPPTMLELELTESVLMVASREHNDLLLRLRKTGYRIAIDDFGSGYSSLDYLRRYPVDRIKIAQSFIAEIGTNSGCDAIVRAALGLARELDIEVVVEGVETSAQLELLRGWGCRIVQGYYYARPLTASDVTGVLRSGKIDPAFADLLDLTAPVDR